jgi:hypothetical protein
MAAATITSAYSAVAWPASDLRWCMVMPFCQGAVPSRASA